MKTNLMMLIALWAMVFSPFKVTHAQFNNPHMVIANRNEATISVIDVATNGVTSFNLPAAQNMPTPGYVVYSPLDDAVYVGDSANARIVTFDARTYQVVGADIPVGAGAFHMWGNAVHNQLWVTNPGDQTVSVIDMSSRTPLATIPAPIVSGMTTTPHDVVLDPVDGAAYVTYFADGADLVLKYSPNTFAEMDRAEVAEDPHVTLTDQNNVLYVATQDGGQLETMDRISLSVAAPAVPITNAHGVTVSADGTTLYVSSFPGGTGVEGLMAIDTVSNSLVNAVDTPAAGSGPHNLALSTDNSRLYATHSGASSLVSVFDISGSNRQLPVFLQTVETGANPFGLAAVSAVPEPGGLGLIGMGTIALLGLRRRRSTGERFVV